MSSKSQPLRTALIGLSSSAVTSWASRAHLPGLLTPAGREKFKIVALTNSSVDAAKAAISKYELPADTKAYGSPEDLAADPDIDLVICNTRVDKHYETIIPSILAGKDVFVEWPIGSNRQQIDDVVAAARKSGSRVAVGLQRRWNPVVLKVKELIGDGNGKLGKILSSHVQAFGGSLSRDVLPAGLEYFTKKEVGGNIVVIGIGHVLDEVLAAIGKLDYSTVQSKSQIQRPEVRIRDVAAGKIIKTVKEEVPDLVTLNGTLAASPKAASNATLTFTFRKGTPFPGTSAFIWTINLEHGEIRIDAPSTTTLETGENDPPVTISVHTFADDKVEQVDFGWNEQQLQVPLHARSVMDTLFAFADGKRPEEGWVDLEEAAKYAELIESFLRV